MREYVTQGRKREGEKERKEGKKEGKKRKKKGRGSIAGYGLAAVAGGGRSWPKKVAQAPNQRQEEGAILVKNGDLEF